MSRPRWVKTEALILKAIPMAEADRLLFLYTPDIGKVRAIVKGARRIRSKLAGHVEPLVRTSLALTPGKNFYTVTEAQILESFRGLRSNLQGTSKAIYLAELLSGFTSENVGYKELYQLFLDGFRFLDRHPENDLALRYLEIHLLRISGVMPELYFCIECRNTIMPNEHRFAPNLGGMLCLKCTPHGTSIYAVSLASLKVLRYLIKESLSSVSRINIPSNVMMEIKYLLSASIMGQLEYDLKSIKFLEAVASS